MRLDRSITTVLYDLGVFILFFSTASRYQTYTVDAAEDGDRYTDYTGYSVTSDKPISVSAGHGFVRVTCSQIITIILKSPYDIVRNDSLCKPT